MKNSLKIDVYQLVTDLIIENLEQGIIPWRRPWNDLGPATNYLTGKPYRGINQLILNGLHTKPFYLTFKQAHALGGRIRKGARSIPVFYWNFTYRYAPSNERISSDELASYDPGDIVKSAFLKYYRVFNADDVLGIHFNFPKVTTQHNNTIEKCEDVICDMKNCPEIRFRENQAYYHPALDYINMPPLECFQTSELFYSILFHELIHSTGHPDRLHRFSNHDISNFNSSSYSREELVAEIGATFLNNHTGILNDETMKDSAAYIQGWLQQLRNDKKFIIEASAKAQKAVDYILNEGS